MATRGEARWKQLVAALARRVGVSPRDVETATEGRVTAAEMAPLMAQVAEPEPQAVPPPVAVGAPAAVSASAQGSPQQGHKEEATVVTTDRAQAANDYMK